jgi:hypothetical protein
VVWVELGTFRPVVFSLRIITNCRTWCRKTQDALDYVYSCKGDCHVFWIHCGNPTLFDKDCRRLAKEAEIPGFDETDSTQDVKQLLKLWLEGDRSGNWVLVLDNADNRSDFFQSTEGTDVSSSDRSANLARYVPRASKGTVIITTRDFSVARQLAGPKGVLSKVEMNPNESEELFKQHFPSGSPYNESDCAQLLRELQYLPLAVTQVAAYLEMVHPMLTPSQYLQKFESTKEDQQRLLPKSVYNPWRHAISESPNAETVLTMFTITFSQIQYQSPLANSILRMITCVERRGIPP